MNGEHIMKAALMTSVIAALLAFSLPVMAAGSGGSGGTETATKCKKGEVWSKNKKKCVKATSGVLPDEELYEQGHGLAKAGHYAWALEVLGAITDKNDPKVLNYIGYSHRKMGDFETGMAYYHQALALNPDFVLAREYLGEGYAASGQVELAKLQLAEIEKRCGTTCEEYQDLAEEIEKAGN
jgi:tetratricopeptide (TPR) repeat protein